MKRRDIREYRVELFDGRGTANVWIVDGYGRRLTDTKHVVAVRTRDEAIAAAKAEGLR